MLKFVYDISSEHKCLLLRFYVIFGLKVKYLISQLRTLLKMRVA